MEQAVFITRVDQLKYCDDNFTRLYFGIEFCERLLPNMQQLKKVISAVKERAVGFSFVTPYVTNKGLKQIEALLPAVAREIPDAEIVFNDWGVFHFLQEARLPVTPVLGRLLTKLKRGPRMMNIIDQVPAETSRYCRTTGLTVPELRSFLTKNNVFRVELDNVLQGVDLDNTGDDIHKSLYLPFACVSTSRFCLTANCEDEGMKEYVGVFPCSRECRKYTFTLFNPVMTLPLVRKGNSIFFMNDTIPEIVASGQIDRIVVQPEIPV
jgi:hypothetical protein